MDFKLSIVTVISEKIKRFSEQKKCVRRRDKGSAARSLMSINSREKSRSFSADGALIVSLYRAVDFSGFHAFLSSLKSPNVARHSRRLHLVDE